MNLWRWDCTVVFLKLLAPDHWKARVKASLCETLKILVPQQACSLMQTPKPLCIGLISSRCMIPRKFWGLGSLPHLGIYIVRMQLGSHCFSTINIQMESFRCTEWNCMFIFNIQMELLFRCTEWQPASCKNESDYWKLPYLKLSHYPGDLIHSLVQTDLWSIPMWIYISRIR